MKSIDSLRALAYKPFRRLFIGAVSSNVGTWTETVTIGIYMETTTKNATIVAAALAAGMVPQAIMGLISGTIADRLSRKYVLITTNILSGCVAGTLATAVALDFARPWLVILLLFAAGFLNSVSFPTWQAFLSDIVPKDKVAGALSLMFAQWNLGRIIGPAVAALFVAGEHYAAALYLNTCSFAVVVAMILLINDNHFQEDESVRAQNKKESTDATLTAGWSYIFSRTSGLRTPFYVYAVTVFWASPFIALIPNIADEVYDYKNLGTSLFTTAQGIGAVCVAVFMTTLHVKFGPTRTQQVFIGTLPFVLILFGLAPNIVVATPISLFFGVTYLGTLTSTTLASQLAAPAHLKGRVSAAFMTVLGVLFPLGSLVQSIFLERYGSKMLFVGSGVILLIIVVAIGALRRTYHLPDPHLLNEDQPGILEVAAEHSETDRYA